MKSTHVHLLLAAMLSLAVGSRVLAAETQWTSAQQDRPATDEAAIKLEVTRVFDGFKAAVEKVDLDSVLTIAADVPEFRYVMPDGAVVDFAGWKQGHIDNFATVTAHRLIEKSRQWFDAATAERTWAEVFSRCAGMKYTTVRESVVVLGPDLALDSWQGAANLTTKDGRVFRYDPLSFTALLRRANGAWRMAYLHQSARPPQQLSPAAVTPANVAPSLLRSDEDPTR